MFKLHAALLVENKNTPPQVESWKPRVGEAGSGMRGGGESC